MAFSDFFSSFKSTVYADSAQEVQATEEPKEEVKQRAEDPKEDAEEEAEEVEEEEPEDLQPVIREECKQAKCAQLAKHFEHCQEKVQSGQGFKGEDCVEEFMMHCIDDCAAPKLFTKLH